MEQPGSMHSMDTPFQARRVDEGIHPRGHGYAWLRPADMTSSVDYNLKQNTLRQLLQKQPELGIQYLGPNLVTNVGDDLLGYTAKGDVTTKGVITHMAYGTPASQPTPLKADTTLQTESSGTGYVRKAISFTLTPGAGSGSISAYTATWGTEVTVAQAIYELGLLTASTGGNLFNHLGFGVINKSATQTLSLECDVTIN